MTSCDTPRRQSEAVVDDAALDQLLQDVRVRFYAGTERAFQRDRRALLQALTWPALWLEHRGLFCSNERYRTLVVARLDAILRHGDPARYAGPSPTPSSGYFPRYLLKTLQDHFDRHGDELHDELKHVRNALDVVLGSLRFVEKAAAPSRQIEALAQAHRFLRANAPAPSDPNQMALF